MKSGTELQQAIERAMKKVQGRKENDLCKFLPGPTGGYMHHFTLKKLKKTNPAELKSLLMEFIVESPKPRALEPKPRAPRGSRKRRDIISFTRIDLDKVLDLARRFGDKDLIAKFSPKRPLANLKRDLIRSIRDNQVNVDLWNAYAEAVDVNQNSQAQSI
ncbi:MAG: hypothetical protein KDK55_02340 [Chlamydiia bacterium]|nr:hypothetical protein [Chlamydiia bacterium]